MLGTPLTVPSLGPRVSNTFLSSTCRILRVSPVAAIVEGVLFSLALVAGEGLQYPLLKAGI